MKPPVVSKPCGGGVIGPVSDERLIREPLKCASVGSGRPELSMSTAGCTFAPVVIGSILLTCVKSVMLGDARCQTRLGKGKPGDSLRRGARIVRIVKHSREHINPIGVDPQRGKVGPTFVAGIAINSESPPRVGCRRVGAGRHGHQQTAGVATRAVDRHGVPAVGEVVVEDARVERIVFGKPATDVVECVLPERVDANA